MSEAQRTPKGAPIGTQPLGGEAAPGLSGPAARPRRSGSNGERRDSGADELSPQAEASERSLSRRVSRETVDLIEIMDRSMPKFPDPPEDETAAEAPSQEETAPPLEQGDPPSPPEKNKPSSFYVYLVILFGAAFLMLLLAYFVQRRNNETAITDLRNTMNLSRGELMEEIAALEKENETLQQDNNQLQEQLDQAEQKSEQLSQIFEDASTQLSIRNAQKLRAEYLVYLGHFMDSGEYPMAALVIMISADRYFGALYIDSQYVALSPIENARYQTYKQELIDKGYLQQKPSYLSSHNPEPPAYTQQTDPEQNPDMAALGILWCAMERYYVLDDPAGAAQYFVNCQEYLMGSPPERYLYRDRLHATASNYLFGLHEQLVFALTDQGYLTWVDGTGEEPGKYEYGPKPVAWPDISVNPPFLHYYYGDGN